LERVKFFKEENLIYREIFNFIDRFTDLRFTATGALPAARGTRISQMNQYT
jgi:hypothetical protein